MQWQTRYLLSRNNYYKVSIMKNEIPGYVEAVQYLTFYIDLTNKLDNNYNPYAR